MSMLAIDKAKCDGPRMADLSDKVPRFIDLSHTVEHGMISYKGLPAPIICDYLSREESRKRYAKGTEFQIGKIEMVANTGAYLHSIVMRRARISHSLRSNRSQISAAW